MNTTIRGLRCACLVWGFAVAGLPLPAGAAIVIPDAVYRAELNYPPPPKRYFEAGGISVDEQWLSGGGVNLGHVTASAATGGGLLPMAAITVDLSGTGNGAIAAEGHAALTYYWAVEQISGTPRNTARVRIHTEGAVSSAVVGDADASPLYAEAIIDFIGSQSVFIAGVKRGTSFLGNSFDATFTKQVAKDTVFSTSLIAYGLANAGWDGGAGTARLDAFVDPLIEIDPEWSSASDFRMLFSSGVGVAPIPEPATYLLWACGLVALLVLRGK